MLNEWRCALCQVSATDQCGLNNHLQGKKHKRREAALGAQKDEKNYSISLFPKKPNSEEGSSGPIDNDQPSGADDLSKNAYEFWCETCKIWTTSEKLMEKHRMGKKHAKRMGKPYW
ncbi:UBP1-associated proteins 1C-like [Lycium ferocissimum]|uniref:UBP1-associated proteins 1C-like n=1 Tax=Lycium ferocissimum TaxID=112874 RepID=UPI002814D4F4|nr:UBP1-associated proteins 1C-like [Lycium ferocissimum]